MYQLSISNQAKKDLKRLDKPVVKSCTLHLLNLVEVKVMKVGSRENFYDELKRRR